jgi:uncharacterized membrane protein YfhO
VSPEVEGDDQVFITRHTPSVVEIQANLAGDGFLVLTDTYYPGWQVYVDGQPRTMFRAYHFARSVFVEGGQHTVRFVYRPISFWGGMGLAVIGLVIVAGAAWQVWLARSNPSRLVRNRSKFG